MKRTACILAALMMVTGFAFGQTTVKGDFSAGVNSEGWALAQGTGDRTHIEFITFDKAYGEAPKVMVSLTGFDATPGKDGTVRVHVAAEKITKVGCVIKIKAWGDSKVNGVWGSYMAFGK